MLLVAPLAYFLVIRKTTVSGFTALRVFMLGVLVSAFILSGSHTPALAFVKTWVSPVVELTLIGFIVRKFRITNRQIGQGSVSAPDFLQHTRAVLAEVLGSKKAADILASEIAVFYYIFQKPDKAIDMKTKFSCYKENGIVLVLNTLLALFLIETVGMHFLFMLFSKTTAWILTALSFYSCMQLFAHIRALKSRPIEIDGDRLVLRKGLMGGDAVVMFSNITRIELTKKAVHGKDVVKLALIGGLENHNIAIYLSKPITVVKAFGITKTAEVILVSIDSPKEFSAYATCNNFFTNCMGKE